MTIHEKEKQNAIRERLQQLAQKNHGRLTPENVLADARKPSSPLHSEFEWDESKAAHAHRLEQARGVIRSVRVVIHTETKTITSVAYVRDPTAGPEEQGYVAVEALREEPENVKAALRYEFGRAEAVLQRARELSVALTLEGRIDHIIEEVRSVADSVAA